MVTGTNRSDLSGKALTGKGSVHDRASEILRAVLKKPLGAKCRLTYV